MKSRKSESEGHAVETLVPILLLEHFFRDISLILLRLLFEQLVGEQKPMPYIGDKSYFGTINRYYN